MAVCDLDSNRVQDAITLINGQYAKTTGKPYEGVTGYSHYRELLANKDVDAVVISTPDHWHALIAIDAVRAGKDVYLQKPASLTIAEGPRPEQRRAPVRTHLPDRQPATVLDAVPLRGRARAQRPHRTAEDRLRRPARRPVRQRRAGDAGAREPQLRHVARLDAGRLLHREPRPPAERLRPPRLAALRAVRRRDDHRLGRAPHRHGALGHGHRIHGADRDLGEGGVSDQRPVGRARPVQDRSALRQRRPHDRQRRVPQRHQVRGDRGLGVRLPGK